MNTLARIDFQRSEIDTPHGPARAHVAARRDPRAALVLGHGAGGGVAAVDLQAVADAARSAGLTVALVEQPYAVAGRRSPAPARQLDLSWVTVVESLREGALGASPLITGGRSSGARVACRTASECGAAAVLCLAFPLHPPGRPENSRLDELDGAGVPVLVVQGDSDPFGMPPPGRGREVVTVPGNHGLKGHLDEVAATVVRWLGEILPPG